jgi:hypothetical protein
VKKVAAAKKKKEEPVEKKKLKKQEKKKPAQNAKKKITPAAGEPTPGNEVAGKPDDVDPGSSMKVKNKLKTAGSLCLVIYGCASSLGVLQGRACDQNNEGENR